MFYPQWHQSEYSADNHTDFNDGLHWRRSALFLSISRFVPTLIAQMVYQEADGVLVTVAHSNNRTEGLISVEQLQMYLTEAPCWAKIYKFILSRKHSSNCGLAASLLIFFNLSYSSFGSNCQVLDKRIDSTFP